MVRALKDCVLETMRQSDKASSFNVIFIPLVFSTVTFCLYSDGRLYLYAKITLLWHGFTINK